ncbi:MAG: Gfo/Idh/MocA family oxidoreductase [Planctomycetes bacterium]|nr:Gfo/Idh/MocA family oxidoreductase [Planctomycetota bacterium]
MADSVFKIGVVGTGGISGAHIAAAKSSGGRVEVVAVAEPNAASREKAAADTGAKAFASIDEMFKARAEGLEIHGVVICTPPSVRLKLVEAALKAKVAVLSEKPLAHVLKDAKKLAALAAKHKKVPSFVAYCHRFAPAINAMKEHVAAGKIGRLVRFENVFACDLPTHETKWFSDPKKAGGGAYLDMGSHSLDLFHYLVGPAKVSGSVFSHKWKKRTETAATVLLESTKKNGANIPAGVAGTIISGWAETCRFTLALVGDGGMLFYDYEKPSELVFKDLSGKAESLAIESHDVRFTRQLVAFADAVQNKAKNQLATFADGLAAAVLDASCR